MRKVAYQPLINKIVTGIVVLINATLAAAEGFEKAINSVKLLMESNIEENKKKNKKKNKNKKKDDFYLCSDEEDPICE